MQQFAPKPQMDGADTALLQASMAETQRRTTKDQTDAQLAQAKMQETQQETQAKLQQDLGIADNDRESKVAMNAENNLTAERIQTAQLTVDEVRLRKEQEATAIKLNQTTQKGLGD